MKSLPLIPLLCSALISTGSAAVLLAVDFEGQANFVTQTDFQSFSDTNVTTAAPNVFRQYGDYTVTLRGVTGNARNRPAFANPGNIERADLLRDQFVGIQGSGADAVTTSAVTVLTLSGLEASTDYFIRLYSYGNTVDTNHVYTWFDNTSGSPQSLGSITNAQIQDSQIVTADEYSVFAQVTSDGSGALRFGFTGTASGTPATTSGTGGINGFVLSAIPEPSHAALTAIGLVTLLLKRRRPLA